MTVVFLDLRRFTALAETSEPEEGLADIARLLESYPELRNQVPGEVLAKLV